MEKKNFQVFVTLDVYAKAVDETSALEQVETLLKKSIGAVVNNITLETVIPVDTEEDTDA